MADAVDLTGSPTRRPGRAADAGAGRAGRTPTPAVPSTTKNATDNGASDACIVLGDDDDDEEVPAPARSLRRRSGGGAGAVPPPPKNEHETVDLLDQSDSDEVR